MKFPLIAAFVATVLVAGCQTHSPRETADARLQELPQDVRVTVQQQIGDAEIMEINRLPHVDANVYQVTYAGIDNRPEHLHVREDGWVLSKAEAEMSGTIVEAAGADQRTADQFQSSPAPVGTQAATSGLSTGTRFEELPPSVQQTVFKHSAGAQIADIDKEQRSGETVYEISFKNGGRNPKIHVAEDGRLLSDTRTGAMQREPAGAQVTSDVRGGAESLQPGSASAERTDALLSVPTRTGGRAVPSQVDTIASAQPDSDISQEAAGAESRLAPIEPAMVRFSALPQPVQNAIRSRAGETQVREINRQTVYEVKFGEETLTIRPDGTIVEGK